MKTNYLLPTVFSKIGWFLFVPSLILGIYYLFGNDAVINIGGSSAIALFDGITETEVLSTTYNDSWTDEILIITTTLSMLFIGFSREKEEDECIANIRMNSLVWSIMVSSMVLIAATLLIFGVPYLTFMTIYMFCVLLLFIIKYKFALYMFRKDNVA
ncbi:MAG: hypothetical protein IKD40_03935 [Bacteroidaceae bacterium]|nr:hypothetical protein [Bacteroidaceae bacterium]